MCYNRLMHKYELAPSSAVMRNEYEQYTPKPKEISIEELVSNFMPEDLEAVAKYQSNKEAIQEVIVNPYPQDFIDKYGKTAAVLDENISTYGEFEDALMEDEVVLSLMELRDNDTNNKGIVRAIRARRSVVVALVYTFAAIDQAELTSENEGLRSAS